jgi:hypothetical protein
MLALQLQLSAVQTITRAEMIAAYMPSRRARLCAFARVCLQANRARVDWADGPDLAALQAALVISDDEARALARGARAGNVIEALDRILSRLARLVPMIVQIQVSGRLADGFLCPSDGDEIAALIADLEELAPHVGLVASEIERAFAAPTQRSMAEVARAVAARVASPTDRYWLATYTLLGELRSGASGWEQSELATAVQAAFALPPETMRQAEAHARILLLDESRSG